jgi:hypothetical protein
MNRYCTRHGIVPANHRCGRWTDNQGRSRWIKGWEKTKAQAYAASGGVCTEPGCNQRAVEVHHINDRQARAVCYQHNPRGG